MDDFIKWEDLGELKCMIRDYTDTGSNREFLCKNITEASKGKYSEKEINQAIDELISSYMIVCAHGYIKVTCWAHSTVLEALKMHDWIDCLKFLKSKRVYHRDMEGYLFKNGKAL